MFDVALLYEMWKETDLTNKRLLELLRKVNGSKESYLNDEDFRGRINQFNSEINEVYQRIRDIGELAEKFHKDLYETERELAEINFLGNRRTAHRRLDIHERRSSDERRSGGERRKSG